MPMKKTAVLLLTVLMMCITSLGVYAESATIAAQVPGTHTVTFVIEGGKVEANGTPVDHTIELDRQRVQTYRLIPDDGYILDQLIYDGEDVTEQVTNNCFTAPPLIGDTGFTVTFRPSRLPQDSSKPFPQSSTEQSIRRTSTPSSQTRDANTVHTGDFNEAVGYFTVLLVLSLCLLIVLTGHKQEKHTTS